MNTRPPVISSSSMLIASVVTGTIPDLLKTDGVKILDSVQEDVILSKWYLRPKKSTSWRVSIVGRDVSLAEHPEICTDVVTTRLARNRLKTASGVVYRLEGKCDAESMAREGYAPVTTTVFTMGFPSNYKEFLEDDLTIRESWKSDQKKRRGIPKRLDNRGDTNIDEGQSLAGTELSLQVTGSLVSERLSFVVNDASQNTLTTTTAQDTLVEDDSSIDSPSMFGGSGVPSFSPSTSHATKDVEPVSLETPVRPPVCAPLLNDVPPASQRAPKDNIPLFTQPHLPSFAQEATIPTDNVRPPERPPKARRSRRTCVPNKPFVKKNVLVTELADRVSDSQKRVAKRRKFSVSSALCAHPKETKAPQGVQTGSVNDMAGSTRYMLRKRDPNISYVMPPSALRREKPKTSKQSRPASTVLAAAETVETNKPVISAAVEVSHSTEPPVIWQRKNIAIPLYEAVPAIKKRIAHDDKVMKNGRSTLDFKKPIAIRRKRPEPVTPDSSWVVPLKRTKTRAVPAESPDSSWIVPIKKTCKKLKRGKDTLKDGESQRICDDQLFLPHRSLPVTAAVLQSKRDRVFVNQSISVPGVSAIRSSQRKRTLQQQKRRKGANSTKKILGDLTREQMRGGVLPRRASLIVNVRGRKSVNPAHIQTTSPTKIRNQPSKRKPVARVRPSIKRLSKNEPFPAAPLLATPKPPIRKAQIRNVNWYKQVVNAVTRPSTGKRKRVNPLFSPDGDVHLTLPKGEWSMHSIAEPNTFSDTTNTFRMSAGKPLIRDSPKKRNYDATNAEDASIRLNLRGFLEEDKRRKMKNPRKKACASSSMWSTHRTFSNRPGLFSMQNLSQALCPEKRNSNAKNEFGAESDGDD